MQGILNCEKGGEHVCQQNSGDKNELSFYYSGNASYEEPAAELRSQGVQDGCAKARPTPGTTPTEPAVKAAVEDIGPPDYHSGASPCELAYPL
jgi:hypothetical protein